MKLFLTLLLALAAPAAFAQFNTLTDSNFPICQDVNGQHLNWNGWLPGGGAVCGTSAPPSAPPTIGTPTSRTLSLATAYQATDNTKPAFVTINLSSNPTLTLGGGSTNNAQIVMGSTSAVASGTGSQMGNHNNSLTGTLVVGVAINNGDTRQYTILLPAGWFFAIRQTAGTVSITSAFDQSMG